MNDMNELLTIKISTPINGRSLQSSNCTSYSQLKKLKLLFLAFDKSNRHLSEHAQIAENEGVLEDNINSWLETNITVELGDLIYLFQYNMVAGGKERDQASICNGDSVDLYSILQYRLAVSAGIEWPTEIGVRLLLVKKLFNKLYDYH